MVSSVNSVFILIFSSLSSHVEQDTAQDSQQFDHRLERWDKHRCTSGSSCPRNLSRGRIDEPQECRGERSSCHGSSSRMAGSPSSKFFICDAPSPSSSSSSLSPTLALSSVVIPSLAVHLSCYSFVILARYLYQLII